eukprot:GABW01004910.1.p1 GENE.GABW01004910.1~~GABW01004910.1.p1  ORF type:complete len:68 (-),score=27.30 GABW01004910.1:3-206(-)
MGLRDVSGGVSESESEGVMTSSFNQRMNRIHSRHIQQSELEKLCRQLYHNHSLSTDVTRLLSDPHST